MKNRRFRFLPQAADRGPLETGLPLAERPARHLMWSGAISGAFRHAKGQWRPVTFIFRLRAKRMLSLVRRVMNFRRSWPRLEQTVAVTNTSLAQPLVAARDRRSRVTQNPSPRNLALRGVPLLFRHIHLHETVSYLERLSEHHIRLQRPEGARPRPPWLAPTASRKSRGPRSHAIRQEVSAPEMTKRIMRRLRKVEEAPLSAEPRLVAFAKPAHSVADNLDAPASKLRREVAPAYHREVAANVDMPTGINVAQLTDEVMRQIDRRLVAVRERMGKI